MNKNHFSSILDSQLGIFWADNEYYPAEYLTEEEKSKIRSISCIRYEFGGVGFDDEEFDFYNKMKKIENFVFQDNVANIYQIYFGYSAEYPNRIRSYKGVLSRKDRDLSSFIEIEIPFGKKTVIGAIIKLNKEAFWKDINLIFDSRKGFIMSSYLDLFSAVYLEKSIIKYINNDDDTSIDYLRMIIELCSNGNKIYKFSNSIEDSKIDCFYSECNF